MGGELRYVSIFEKWKMLLPTSHLDRICSNCSERETSINRNILSSCTHWNRFSASMDCYSAPSFLPSDHLPTHQAEYRTSHAHSLFCCLVNAADMVNAAAAVGNPVRPASIDRGASVGESRYSDPWTMRLSVMDIRMNSYSFRVVYVFPPVAAAEERERGKQSYSAQQLERSFEELLREDYPFLLHGELHEDPFTGVLSVRSRMHSNKHEPQRLEFDTNTTRTTKDVLHSADFSLLPLREPQALIAVKCSFLRDGGMVLALDINHCVFDGESCFTFMKQWGLHYRGVKKSERPVVSHDARHLLFDNGSGPKLAHPEYTIIDPSPALQQCKPASASAPPAQLPKTTQHIFRISQAQLQALKTFAVSGMDPSNAMPAFLSTTDAVTALVVLLITRARGHRKDVNVGTAVNGRRRLDPPLPENYAGNVVFTAFSSFKACELQTPTAVASASSPPISHNALATIAQRLRQSIQKQDNAYMRDTIEFLAAQQNPRCIQASTKFVFGADVMVSSWTDLGAHDADFGAHPLYVTSPATPICDGLVVLQESCASAHSDGRKSKKEQGLDVLVYLEVDAMARLASMWSQVPCWVA